MTQGQNKKGQTAIEYLMTYGWAILIILVVGGVLYYYGVFSPSTLVGESKTGFGQVELIDWEVDAATDNVLVLLENRAGAQIIIYEVVVDSTTATWTNATMSEGSRETQFRTISGTGLTLDAGDTYRIDLTFTYVRTDADNIGLSSSGSISGTAS